MEKPKKPIKPKYEDYKTPTIPNGKNSKGDPLYQKLDYIEALKKYYKECEKYDLDMGIYEQLKLIKIIKYSKEKLILKKYKIIKL